MPIVTGIKVVDASALAAILFAEPEAEVIAERLTGTRLAAPALLDYELANVCLIKIRRRPSQREALRAAFRLAHLLKVETVAVDHAAVLDLAEATGLTAYDASYLWLARSLGGELVTLDRKLAAASQESERLRPAPVPSLSQVSACQQAI
ncbi:MAG: type II toxin-antitoxin system VapC family toxin [Acetobacteraceae bacterium]